MRLAAALNGASSKCGGLYLIAALFVRSSAGLLTQLYLPNQRKTVPCRSPVSRKYVEHMVIHRQSVNRTGVLPQFGSKM